MMPPFGFLLVIMLASDIAFVSATNLPPRSPARGAVQIRVQNVLFHLTDAVVLTVTRLEGWMIPRSGQTVSLDRKNSFVLQIESGETHLKALALTLNDYLLFHAKTPIKNARGLRE